MSSGTVIIGGTLSTVMDKNHCGVVMVVVNNNNLFSVGWWGRRGVTAWDGYNM